MTDHSGYTLRRLAPERLDHMRDAIKRTQADNPDLKAKKLPGVAFGVAEKAVTERLMDALGDIDLFDLIARAWAKAPELQKVADEADHSVGKTASVRLGEHDLSVDLFPLADITFATFAKMTVEFTLELQIGLTVADVTITDRKIVKIGRTEGQVSVTLNCGPLSLGRPLKSKILFHDELVLKSPATLAPTATVA